MFLVANWSQIFKNRALQPCLHRVLSQKLHFREKPALSCLPPDWTACLHCIPARWTNPYKVHGILLQPIRLRLSPSSQSCAAIAHQCLHQPIREVLFWSIRRKVLLRLIKLLGIEVLIWIKMDQSGTSGGNFYLYNYNKISYPLVLGAPFPFLLKTEDCISPSGSETHGRCLTEA